MSDNIVTIKVDKMLPQFKPKYLVQVRPTKGEVDSIVDTIDALPEGEKYILVVLDDTPRENLDTMNDYSYLGDDPYKYRYVSKPFWSDDINTLQSYLDYLWEEEERLDELRNWKIKVLDGANHE